MYVIFAITAQKMKFSIKDFFSKCDINSKFPADLVTFTEEAHAWQSLASKVVAQNTLTQIAQN